MVIIIIPLYKVTILVRLWNLTWAVPMAHARHLLRHLHPLRLSTYPPSSTASMAFFAIYNCPWKKRTSSVRFSWPWTSTNISWYLRTPYLVSNWVKWASLMWWSRLSIGTKRNTEGARPANATISARASPRWPCKEKPSLKLRKQTDVQKARTRDPDNIFKIQRKVIQNKIWFKINIKVGTGILPIHLCA